MLTAKEFQQITGFAPRDDDLERANCDKVGQIGHFMCGMCECGKPRFLCATHCISEIKVETVKI